MRKTKIIASYGYSIDKKELLARLVRHVDVFRINTAHGVMDTWLSWKSKVEDAAAKADREIPVLADLPGPKIRIGKLEIPRPIKSGEKLCLEYAPKSSTDIIPVNYNNLYKDAQHGTHIVIGDGIVKLNINRISGRKIYCTSLNSGTISSMKGISLPGAPISAHVPTSEDVKIARFALKNGFDYLGMSFVGKAKSVDEMRKNVGDCFIIAKIETKEGIENISDIAKSADAIMVARGDLALDIPIEQLPAAQRKIIDGARARMKPVIVATQMLASMTKNIMPTRAEVSDIAGSVMEGVDALMLSDETAVGDYPLNAVEVLSRTITETEKSIVHGHPMNFNAGSMNKMAFAAAEIGNEYGVERIFVPTITGSTPKMMAALRPGSDIVALSEHKKIRRQMGMYYGVKAMEIEKFRTEDQMTNMIHKSAMMIGTKKYLVVFGTPGKSGKIDTIRYFEW